MINPTPTASDRIDATFQFVPHHQIADFQARGWVVADDFADCHHGAHSVLMRAPDDEADRIAKHRGLEERAA